MAKSKSTTGTSVCGPDPKWQAEDDLRTMERAEEIKADPARMKKAAEVAKEKSAALNKVTEQLARKGLISDKAKAKIKGKSK